MQAGKVMDDAGIFRTAVAKARLHGIFLGARATRYDALRTGIQRPHWEAEKGQERRVQNYRPTVRTSSIESQKSLEYQRIDLWYARLGQLAFERPTKNVEIPLDLREDNEDWRLRA